MVFVAAILIQSMFVGVEYIRLLGLVHEAAHIASSSGDPDLRIAQAEEFLRNQEHNLGARITSDGSDVTVSLAMSLPTVLMWRPELHVSETSMLVDDVAT
ncbi:MAG: hypothetical protein RL410_1603 [Actinomycetota bacterium]